MSATVHHVGLTVPDLGEATAFLVEYLGCDHCFTTTPGTPMSAAEAAKLNAEAGAECRGIAMLRTGNLFIELFEYRIPGQADAPPRSTDVGGSHIAFAVPNIGVAAERLAAAGARLCSGVNEARSAGFEGLKWLYFVAPWGQTFELVELSQAPQLQLERG